MAKTIRLYVMRSDGTGLYWNHNWTHGDGQPEQGYWTASADNATKYSEDQLLGGLKPIDGTHWELHSLRKEPLAESFGGDAGLWWVLGGIAALWFLLVVLD